VRDALLPWGWVHVWGPSMVPTLGSGDRVIVRYGAGVCGGDVVLARFRTWPDQLVIKRAVRPVDGGWWLASDNRYAGGDSAAHGVADVTGVAVLRLRRGWRPTRLRPLGPQAGGGAAVADERA
jgi:SOS-response transcriptional repressor LexA